MLALRALGLGDLLTAVPALRALARAHGPVTLATSAWLEPLALLTGAVAAVLPTAPLGAVPWPGPRPPELAVNLHGKGPQSTATLRALRPGRLVAYDAVGALHWDDSEHERARWCRLVSEVLHVPADPDDVDLPVPEADAPAGVAVVHPGGAAPARHWPVERWVAVARTLAASSPVVVTGSPAEEPLARHVAAAAGLPATAALAGRLDLLGLAALVARARVVLSSDTGIAHLATAYRTPSVVLFGPVPPSRWGPHPSRPQHVVLWPGPESDPFADTPAPALLTLTPGDVLAASERASGSAGG